MNQCINFFLFLWAIFTLLDLDPVANSDRDPETPLNPDPQHCVPHTTILKKQCFGSGSRQAICPQKRNKFHIWRALCSCRAWGYFWSLNVLYRGPRGYIYEGFLIKNVFNCKFVIKPCSVSKFGSEKVWKFRGKCIIFKFKENKKMHSLALLTKRRIFPAHCIKYLRYI